MQRSAQQTRQRQSGRSARCSASLPYPSRPLHQQTPTAGKCHAAEATTRGNALWLLPFSARLLTCQEPGTTKHALSRPKPSYGPVSPLSVCKSTSKPFSRIQRHNGDTNHFRTGSYQGAIHCLLLGYGTQHACKLFRSLQGILQRQNLIYKKDGSLEAAPSRKHSAAPDMEPPTTHCLSQPPALHRVMRSLLRQSSRLSARTGI